MPNLGLSLNLRSGSFAATNVVLPSCLDSSAHLVMYGPAPFEVRTLRPIGYPPYGKETYNYYDETVRFDGSAWIYENSSPEYGELARVYSNADWPWLVSWPAPYSAEKLCLPFSETGAFWQSCAPGGCNNVTTPSGWNIPADSIHTFTNNKMQFNSAGDGTTTFTHTYSFPYTADSTSPYNGNGWPAVQFQPRIGLPATPVFDGGTGSMCRVTWNNMVIFEQIDGTINYNMGYNNSQDGQTNSILQELQGGVVIPYSYSKPPNVIPGSYFMNFKIESVNSSLEFEIGFLWD